MRPLSSHFAHDALPTLDSFIKHSKEARVFRRAQAVRGVVAGQTVQAVSDTFQFTNSVGDGAFYACSAKWYFRPNEMLRLDRYASFGLPMPEAHRLPPGFEGAFQAHPEVASFDQGGDKGLVAFGDAPPYIEVHRVWLSEAQFQIVPEGI